VGQNEVTTTNKQPAVKRLLRPIRSCNEKKSKKKSKLDSKSKGKDSEYAKAFAIEMEMDDSEIFPVLRKMKRRDLIKYCAHYKLSHSQETHREKLLAIVTKHFIQRSRIKNDTSIEFFEEELFWHSIVDNANMHGQEEEE